MQRLFDTFTGAGKGSDLIPRVTEALQVAIAQYESHFDATPFFAVARMQFMISPMVVNSPETDNIQQALNQLSKCTWQTVDQTIAHLIFNSLELIKSTQSVIYFNIDNTFSFMVDSGNALIVFVIAVLRIQLLSLFNVHKILAATMASEEVLLIAITAVKDALVKLNIIISDIATATETTSDVNVADIFSKFDTIYNTMTEHYSDIVEQIEYQFGPQDGASNVDENKKE